MRPDCGSASATAGRLPHLHDGGLEEPEPDDVPARTGQGDPVADAEGVTAQDHEVGGEGGDDLRQGKCQADDSSPAPAVMSVVGITQIDSSPRTAMTVATTWMPCRAQNRRGFPTSGQDPAGHRDGGSAPLAPRG
jgi:hypothetical protein